MTPGPPTSDFLLDTNVVSEWVKPQPNIGVIRWLDAVDEDRTRLSVVTLAEIRLGIERLEPGRRRERLTVWLEEDLPARFADRLLHVDREVAVMWGVVMAETARAGHSMSSMDAWFAATARHYGLTLVTRNARDFVAAGIALVNPWIE
jgi:predicted nucleic acid-binding protein